MIKLILGGFPCTEFSIAQKNNRINKVDFTADEFIEWHNTPEWWLHIDEFEKLVANNLGIEDYKFALGLQLFLNCIVAVDRAKLKGDTVYYLFENVASMQKQIKQVMEEILHKLYNGQMTEINSSKVSAQNRKRIYFTNYGEIEQPEDRGILLKDILDSNMQLQVTELIPVNDIDGKSCTIRATCYKDTIRNLVGNDVDRRTCVAEPVKVGEIGKGGQGNRIYSVDGKAVSQTATSGGVGSNTGLYAEPIRIGTLPNNDGVQSDNQSKRIYSVDGKSVNLCSGAGGLGAQTGLYAEPIGCYCVNIPQEITKRKYDVDIPSLKELLITCKKRVGITNKDIAEKLKKPQTLVEHWFRRDGCFAIPDADSWHELKNIIGIDTDNFDKCITEFIEQDGVFEKSDRCYITDGKMSTLMTGGGDNIIEPIKVCQIDGKYDSGGEVGQRTGLYAEPVSVRCRGREVDGISIGKWEAREDGKNGSLTANDVGCMIAEPVAEAFSMTGTFGNRKIGTSDKAYCLAANPSSDMSARVIESTDGKSYPIYEVLNGFITIKGKQYKIKLPNGYYIIRKLSIPECMRLQTIPDWYIMPCSGTQNYKMLGNGWNIETILHIVNHIPGIQTEELEVISLYDGMSCGRIVLKELDCKVTRYSAFEIDKYAIQTTQANFPDVNELGDAFAIRDVNWQF